MDVGCNYHWYYLSSNIMAEALDESFNTVEELEISQIEELASVPNFDNLATCSCHGNCIRERGRNFCPCKSLNQHCSSLCHVGNHMCLNNRRAEESNSDNSSSSVSFVIYNLYDYSRSL